MKTINMIIMAIVATMMVVGTAMAGICCNGCDITSTAGVAISGASGVTMQGFNGKATDYTRNNDGLNTGGSNGTTTYNGAAVGTSANGLAVTTVKVDKTGHCCSPISPSADGTGTFKSSAYGYGLAGSGTYDGSICSGYIKGSGQGAAMGATYSTSSVVTVNAR